MLIEAAKGGHTGVVQLLLDYPHSIMINSSHNSSTVLISQDSESQITQQSTQILAEYSQQDQSQQNLELNQSQILPTKHSSQKSLLRKHRSVTNVSDLILTSAEAQQVRSQPSKYTVATVSEDANILDERDGVYSNLSTPSTHIISTSVSSTLPSSECRMSSRHEQIMQKQQILEELQVFNVTNSLLSWNTQLCARGFAHEKILALLRFKPRQLQYCCVVSISSKGFAQFRTQQIIMSLIILN